MNKLLEWANALREAERLGDDYDCPEGARYIQISDTLAKEFEADLRELAELD